MVQELRLGSHFWLRSHLRHGSPQVQKLQKIVVPMSTAARVPILIPTNSCLQSVGTVLKGLRNLESDSVVELPLKLSS